MLVFLVIVYKMLKKIVHSWPRYNTGFETELVLDLCFLLDFICFVCHNCEGEFEIIVDSDKNLDYL